MKNIPLPSLTSLRFFAALLVFFSHMDALRSSGAAAADFYNTWFYEGYSGVTFFFVLSGFILAHSYQDRIVGKKSSTTDFFIYRIARIVPLHWLTLAIAIFLLHKQSGSWDFFSTESFWLNFFLLHAFFNQMDIMNSYNMVSWSLSDEMFFYLLFPLLIRFRTWMLVVILFLLIVAALTWLPVTLPFTSFHLPMYTNQWKYYAYFFPVFRLADFLAGIILYRAWRAQNTLPSTLASALQGTSLIILGLFYSLHAGISEIYRYDFYYALPMAFLIYAFAYQNGFFARLLANRPMVILGEASFAFYMIHQMEVYYMGYPIVQFIANNIYPPLMSYYLIPKYYVCIHLLISVLLSLILFFLFEKIAQRTFNKILFWVKDFIVRKNPST